MHVAIKELSEMLLVQRHSAAGWTKASGAELGTQGVDNRSGNQAAEELHGCCGPGLTSQAGLGYTAGITKGNWTRFQFAVGFHTQRPKTESPSSDTGLHVAGKTWL